MNGKIPCSVEILTRNSALTMERCLESVKDFAEIVVLDGNSTDKTLEIALRYGCRVYKQYETDEPLVRISDFSEIRNKGLRLATYDWFMFIDSDEYLSPGAVEEIRKIVESPAPPASAFWQPRKYVVLGKLIECVTTYPNQQIRLFRRSQVEGFIKPVHERIKLREGTKIGRLQNVEYVPIDSPEMFSARLRRYIETEARRYENSSRQKICGVATKQLGLFLLYALRFSRNLFTCRGPRMPIVFEWTMHKYRLILVGKLFRKLL